eukprot:UN24337
MGAYRHAWLFTDCGVSNTEILSRITPMIELLDKDLEPYDINFKSYLTLSFSLFNSYPTEDWKFIWNWTELYQKYLNNFFVKLKPVFEPKIESQVLYYGNMVEDQSESCLSEQTLRSFIGNTKWNIISTATENQVVEFLTFIPSEER